MDKNDAQGSKKYYSTFRQPTEIQQASVRLFHHFVPDLLKALYTPDPGNPHGATLCALPPETKVGVAIKILYNTPPGAQFPAELLLPVLGDIEKMLRDSSYLAGTGQASLRRKCLRHEHDLIQRYMDLDTTLSLNAPEGTATTMGEVGTLGAVTLLGGADPKATIPTQMNVAPDSQSSEGLPADKNDENEEGNCVLM